MENNKSGKIYVVITLLSVLVVLMGGYIVYESFIKDNNKNNNNNNNGNTIKEDIPKTDNTVSKINNDKEWIYDAEYTKTVNVSSYKTQSGTYYAKDWYILCKRYNSSIY